MFSRLAGKKLEMIDALLNKKSLLKKHLRISLFHISLREIWAVKCVLLKSPRDPLTPSLRLERGGEYITWSSLTKTVIFRLIYKICRHMIHRKIPHFQNFDLGSRFFFNVM